VFVVATLAIRANIARGKRDRCAARRSTWLAVAAAVACAAGVLALALAGTIPTSAGLAVAPAVVVALAITIRPVAARRLRTLGWSIATAMLLTLAILVTGVRGGI
jgi:hypothetical protein